MKFGQFVSYYKRKNCIKKIYKNFGLKTSSRSFWVANNEHNFYWEMKLLKQAIYNRYVVANLSKFVQISILTST